MAFNQMQNVTPLRSDDPQNKVRHVFIRNYITKCLIGIYKHEKERKQRIRVNLGLVVSESEARINDEIKNVFCYEKLINGINEIISLGHINLVETLAEKVVSMCFKQKDVLSVRVKIEKLDVLEGAESVGIEIERSNL